MIRQKLLIISSTLLGALAFAQVGINTESPQATLDVVAKKGSQAADGILVPRVSASDLSGKDSVYGTAQNGALVFVTSGSGSTDKTSAITGSGFYYYDAPTSKWKTAGGSTSSTSNFTVTTEKTTSYAVLPDDGYIRLNINSSGHTLTLPVSGVSVGKIVYVSNVGSNGIDISPAPRNTSFTQVQAGTSGALVYLGGSGNGSWDMVSGY